MDPLLTAFLFELGKSAMQQGVLYMKMAGKTKEERDAAFAEANGKFDAITATPLTPPPPEEGGTS